MAKKESIIYKIVEQHGKYIKSLKRSYNWHKWEESLEIELLQEIEGALNLKKWLLERPALILTEIEKEAGLRNRLLNVLTNEDMILSPEQMKLIKPVLSKFGWQTEPKQSPNMKHWLTENRDLLSYARLDKEAGLTPYTIDNHVNKNHQMSHNTYKKLLPVFTKYGYWE